MTRIYDVVCTAVTDRADLFVASMDSLLRYVDAPPRRLVVHEDTRAAQEAQGHNASYRGAIESWLRATRADGRIEDFAHRVRAPAGGMGSAVVWAMETAGTEFVLFTQEDWELLRPVPIAATIDFMSRRGVHHVSFNKRKTMPYKGEGPTRWNKVPVTFAEEGEVYGVADPARGPVFTVCDHWRTQLGLWRREAALPALRQAAAMSSQSNAFVARFNDLMNTAALAAGGAGRRWNDQRFRQEWMRTFLFGPIGEPPFIRHLGSRRGTGHIVDHLAESSG